jgi:hypothetical protein
MPILAHSSRLLFLFNLWLPMRNRFELQPSKAPRNRRHGRCVEHSRPPLPSSKVVIEDTGNCVSCFGFDLSKIFLPQRRS